MDPCFSLCLRIGTIPFTIITSVPDLLHATTSTWLESTKQVTSNALPLVSGMLCAVVSLQPVRDQTWHKQTVTAASLMLNQTTPTCSLGGPLMFLLGHPSYQLVWACLGTLQTTDEPAVLFKHSESSHMRPKTSLWFLPSVALELPVQTFAKPLSLRTDPNHNPDINAIQTCSCTCKQSNCLQTL